ncbi:S9 family peptidase [Marinilongibacter aquaticus]|uniref:S9 family peptidase n=1 Tax=Marinilongibacter aquaticus TaxID=2975157 RepID=UPI0021BD7FCD|nr:S9 family peptidase [Marinilongibacter aquaticus]UBM58177.1 S9 family peptidase [Marinilongibacter aquaticus]
MFRRLTAILCLVCFAFGTASAQPGSGTKWTPDGNGYYMIDGHDIVRFDLKSQKTSVVIPASEMTPANANAPLDVENFVFTPNQKMLLIYTNSQRVWRYNTRGDYWLLDRESKSLKKLGAGFEPGTLMFAKVSPDGQNVAYVQQRNIYVENLKTGKIEKITETGGNPRLINGTFDWAYEEEFSCYDGFRWNADGKQIAYWQLDASGIKDFNIINYTDDIYSKVIPIEYPKVGQSPSVCKIGVVDIKRKKTVWMNVPGDPQQHYIPRMEWAPNGKVMLQQLNRKQQVSKLFYADPKNGEVEKIFEESDEAWVDVRTIWHDDNPAGWEWINDGREFLWVSDKDGWNHIYRISQDGKEVRTVTDGDYDVIDPLLYDENTDQIYFTASPDNAMQRYLYAIKVGTKADAQRITPAKEEGTNGYNISTNGVYAQHAFNNYYTPRCSEWITLPDHKSLDPANGVDTKILEANKAASNVEFVHVKTASGVDVAGWMAYPTNFDPAKKYATVFYVYGEPAGQTALDNFNAGKNRLYNGSMADDGYIYISVDGRGSPAPKGRVWRKAIYKNIGIINIKDQAEAAQALMQKYPFIDKERIAVHGWSGGGSSTLNLLFQYPEIYQTGIAVAAVANQLTYDNIYQERYMGVPPADLDAFVQGSPITHAKNLKGNLLYIHGTGDDNVHYQNAEMLLNELIKYNKQFQFMAYPNRTHGIFEGEGTRKHLNTLFTNYLKSHCVPGAK